MNDLKRSALAASAVAVITLIGTARAGDPALIFTDVSATAGVELVDTLTESVAWGDYDNDGDEDLYLTNDGMNRLFRNEGGDRFTDVTTEAGVGNDLFGVGAAFGDLDNDGYLDLYVVNFFDGLDVLYRNDGPVGPGGAYTFSDISAFSGIAVDRSSRGVALLDYDHDGRLDIYVNAIDEDILYHNLGIEPYMGNPVFEDVAGRLGVATIGQGVGAVATDLDNNGWIDLFTGNRSFDLNRLYRNDGGVFTDMTVAAGIDAVGLGMGVLSFDYDNDLDFDLYWTTWPDEVNRLYRNEGEWLFVDVAGATGTTDPDGWGISCNAGDVDNDGWMDFFVTNGFDPGSSANVLFRNQKGVSFTDATASLGGGLFDGRGVAFADYDLDGDLDICVTGASDAPTRLWRNDTVSGNHYLTLKLVGRSSNASAIGARIELSAGGMTTVQEVSGGAGRGSFNSLPVEFGLAGETVAEDLFIRWPSGLQQRLTDVEADQLVTIVEPLPGDINGNDVIDTVDLLLLFGAWGDCVGCPEDFNGDNVVDVVDLLILFGNWS